ncbi:LPS export ABC transporter periplasmic protein LptC [Betaproteobacteria bacterium PRO4]|uniref:LPS export ABC transporter periplasmic protein LptC n=1 Tax=Nitrosomonas sp. TaxID=42353 RepID=UPI0025621419|nr:LPS export ABC transporter periplasmic protein LptC [Nitrosomonas sp.]MDL1866695.1 LPS export ABC transporter periplasmic protein LptC [Betaproteobacteria bacterium PRO4]
MKHSLLLRPSVWLVILLLLTLWLDKNLQQQNQQPAGNEQQEVDYIIEHLDGVQVNHTLRASRFFLADKLIHYPAGDITQLEHAKLTSIEPDKPLLRVIADQAKLTEGSNDIFLSRNVSIIRGNDQDKDKVTMLTDFLHVIPDTDIAKTDQPVTVIRMNSIANAVGMFVNNQTGEILLQSRVTAHDDRTPRTAR